jgi:hypothetical protein
MRFLKLLCCAAALAAVTAPLAHAQGGNAEWTKKTHLTFSAPVQIPGKTLPAGTYTFRVMDLLADRHVLQILDDKESELIATVMAVSQSRMEAAEDNVVMFSERPAGSPPAIKLWYYPGDKTGNEFVYPRAQAMEIAKTSNTTVLSRDDEDTSSDSMKAAKVKRINAHGQEVHDDDEDDDGADHADHHKDGKAATPDR